jgi:phage N-6-adenine-methyltransferase
MSKGGKDVIRTGEAGVESLLVVVDEGMRGSVALFSSGSDQWSTPIEFFNPLNQEFSFTLDVCADAVNTKCTKFYSEAQDGLAQPWTGSCWMNPPYGKTIGLWVKKAYESSKFLGATVVCLLPARTDTRWFHSYCLHGELRWIKGRLRFSGSKNPATFPSFLCVFRPLCD